MTTKHLTGAYPSGYALDPVYDALVLKPTASVGGTGVFASALATITNLGTVIATATYSDGVVLQAGGAVTNGSATHTSALIEATNGGFTSGWDIEAGASANVTNFATLAGLSGAYLVNGGTVINGSNRDTTAAIDVSRYAVLVLGAPASIENFGTIESPFRTIRIGRRGHPASGATITNGSPTDTTARIQAGQVAIACDYGPLTLTNFGTIASHQGDIYFGAGSVTNGSETDTTALITGKQFDGVAAGAAVANFGTISAADGVFLLGASGSLTNGSATDRVALVEGYENGVLDNGGLVTNFATIQGVGQGRAILGQLGATVDNFGVITGSRAVYFQNGNNRLIVEAGSSLIGAVTGGGGTLELAAASGTITALGAGGTLSGGQVGTVSGFGAYVFDSATAWTLAGGASLAAGQSLTLADHATLAAGGVIANAGTIALASSGSATRLVVAAATTLAGGGLVALSDSVANIIVGATPTTSLTNLETIAGAGLIGEGRLALINGASGVIDATGSKASRTLAIDTGAQTIVNAGLIESTARGALTIAGAVANSGTLAALAGRLTVEGAVTGPGVGVIGGGGVLDFAGPFSGAVSFTGAKGTLELGQSQAYAGTVTGFSRTGGTAFDLGDIGFVASGEATFSRGVLTVTDGTHTARIALVGAYRSVTFVAASDNHGGTLVTALAAPAPPPTASVSRFASAAASLAHVAAAPSHQPAEGHGGARLLARPAA